MSDYERQREQTIRRNQALLQQLGLPSGTDKSTLRDVQKARRTKTTSKARSAPARALSGRPSRSSARLAATISRSQASATRDVKPSPLEERTKSRTKQRLLHFKTVTEHARMSVTPDDISLEVFQNPQDAKLKWASWTAVGPAPARDDLTGFLRFADWPTFTPNKTPAEMLREGVFGGSYFRPLFSKRLGFVIDGDWEELPKEWIQGLNPGIFLTSPTYDADVNKYKVACGQSIEQWEENGWIDVQHDIRGWFQWYCRFYQGRRCRDDERQIGRWARCVGDRGRWRRALLKKYGQYNIRSVFADLDDAEEGENKHEVSPTVHQTCLQWAFEVRQSILDDYWTSQ